ncbi:MAG: lysostaphin resistance A-like protein [Promethearchaeota archaeon]
MEQNVDLNFGPGKRGDLDDRLYCSYCKKDLSKYRNYNPRYCSYCGAEISSKGLPDEKKDTNILTGRATWKIKWSLLAPLIGLGFMFLASFVAIFIIMMFYFSSHPELMGDFEAMMDGIMNILYSPIGTALLSFFEFPLIIAPFVLLKKHQKKMKNRFLLLGWRPYFPAQEGKNKFLAKHLCRDLLLGLFFAFALVGIQQVVSIFNDIIWSPIIEFDDSSSLSLTPSNIPELLILVLSMILVVGPTEEILYRGFSQQGLEARMSSKKAVLVNACLFMIPHIISAPFYLFIPYLSVSLLISLCYWRVRNLNILIFTHGIYDSLLVILLYVQGQGNIAFVDVSLILAIITGALFLTLLIKDIILEARRVRLNDLNVGEL